MRRAHFLTAISFLGFFSELSAFSAVNFPAPLRPWRPLREAPGVQHSGSEGLTSSARLAMNWAMILTAISITVRE